MSKELTPFQALTEIAYVYGYDKNIEIIDDALEEYETLKKCYKNELENTAYYNNLALKYKRALEIIKKYDYMVLFDYNLTYEEMVKDFEEDDVYEIGDYPTKEEYELLKEVLL